MQGNPETVAIRDLGARVGGEVTLQGWLYGRRSGGKVQFLLVRDGTGLCQCVVEAARTEAFAVAETLTQESSLRVSGTVRADVRAPGGWELAVSEVRAIQIARDYPIARKSHGIEFLIQHRHLWLRSPRQAAILRIRHALEKAARDFFDGRGFTLIDAPILMRGAGEDSQSLFPVEYFGETVYLSQTGQLHIESACLSLGKVYCFGPTFRAEKSKTRRHLTEFWMIEPEMAFAELEAVISLAEDFVCHLVQSVLAGHAAELESLGRDLGPLRDVCKPFPRITYTEAAEDLRSAPTRARLDAELVGDRARLEERMAELRSRRAELDAARNPSKRDRLAAQVREMEDDVEELAQDVAVRPEHIRLAQSFEWGKDLGGSDETILSRQFARPVFVTHYPREAKAFYMKANAADARVVNNFDLLAPEGYGEIIGGSQREEDYDAIVERMKEKGIAPAAYEWYLDLRRYGSVPHGGFGLGIERTLTWLCGLRHVREAIPFARTVGRAYP